MDALTVSPSSFDMSSLLDSTSSQQSQTAQTLIPLLLVEIIKFLAQAAAHSGASEGAGAGANNAGSDGYSPNSTADAAVAPAAGSTPASAASDSNSSNSSNSSATSPAGGDTPASSPASSAAGITNNAGGVPQAGAVSGISPASSVVKYSGTGNDKFDNVTNDTSRTESFTYSVEGENKGTITLAPGQTGTFVTGDHDESARVSPSDRVGDEHPNEEIEEDSDGRNRDISGVDGKCDFGGNKINMTETLSSGRSSGDGDPIRAYQNPTDDAAAMGLAGDASSTVNIVVSDAK